MAAIEVGGAVERERETHETLIEAVRQNAPGRCDRWYCACFRAAVARILGWIVIAGLLIAAIVVFSVGWESVKGKSQSIADQLTAYVTSSIAGVNSAGGGSWHATLGGEDVSYPWTVATPGATRLVGTVDVRAPSTLVMDVTVAPVAAGWTPANAVIGIVVRDRAGALPPRNVTTVDRPSWAVQTTTAAAEIVTAATRGDAVCFAVLERATQGLVTSTCVHF